MESDKTLKIHRWRCLFHTSVQLRTPDQQSFRTWPQQSAGRAGSAQELGLTQSALIKWRHFIGGASGVGNRIPGTNQHDVAKATPGHWSLSTAPRRSHSHWWTLDAAVPGHPRLFAVACSVAQPRALLLNNSTHFCLIWHLNSRRGARTTLATATRNRKRAAVKFTNPITE